MPKTNAFGDPIDDSTPAPQVNAFGDPIAAAPSAGPDTRSASEKLGIKNRIGAGIVDFGESFAKAPQDLALGVGSGVVSTGMGIYNLARKAIPSLPPVPEVINQAAEAPDSVAGKIGKAAEQAGEFLIPSGAIARGAKVVEGATAGMRGANALRVAGRAALEGAGAGAVTTAQTGDPNAGLQSGAITAGMSAAIPAAASLIPERMKPRGLYQSALRPGLSKKNLPKIDQEVETGLNEGIRVNKAGLRKAEDTIESLNDEIGDKIAAKSDELGPVISPREVASRVRQKLPTFQEQVNPTADLNALEASKNEFLKKHSRDIPYTKVRPGTEEATGSMVPEGPGIIKQEAPMTLAEAQAEKRGTYRQVKGKYGELSSAAIEAQKALARGLKEEIVARIPELSKLNAREGALIELQDQLERMIAREGNKNLLGIVPTLMSGDVKKFMATLALDNPAIKSTIAIALRRAGKLGITAPGVARSAAAATSAIRSNEPPDLETPGQ